jgi:hypothetical protein
MCQYLTITYCAFQDRKKRSWLLLYKEVMNVWGNGYDFTVYTMYTWLEHYTVPHTMCNYDLSIIKKEGSKIIFKWGKWDSEMGHERTFLVIREAWEGQEALGSVHDAGLFGFSSSHFHSHGNCNRI